MPTSCRPIVPIATPLNVVCGPAYDNGCGSSDIGALHLVLHGRGFRQSCEERHAAGVGDLDVEQFALEREVPVEADNLVAARAADELRLRRCCCGTSLLPTQLDLRCGIGGLSAYQLALAFDHHLD